MNGQQSNGVGLFQTEQNRCFRSEMRQTMPGKALDRRIQKTLQLLQNALVELIAEQDYGDISIQDILERANVGRSTFYAHFENKDQLLRSILMLLNARFEEGIAQMSAGDQSYEANSANMPFNVLQFVEQNHRLFRAMLGKPHRGSLANPLYDYLLVVTQAHFRAMIDFKQTDKDQIEMATHYYASAFIGVLEWWLANDMPYSAAELGQRINQLTLPGLEAAFGN